MCAARAHDERFRAFADKSKTGLPMMLRFARPDQLIERRLFAGRQGVLDPKRGP
jgi:hypothetical protein